MKFTTILLLILLPLALCCLIGVIVGKRSVKKASGQLRAVLTPRQRLLCLASFAVGIAFVLLGIFYQPAADTGDINGMDGMDGMDMGMAESGMESIVVFENPATAGGDMDIVDANPEAGGEVEETAPDADAAAVADGDAAAADGAGEAVPVDGEEADAEDAEVAEDTEADAAEVPPPVASGGGGGVAQEVPARPRRAPAVRSGNTRVTIR